MFASPWLRGVCAIPGLKIQTWATQLSLVILLPRDPGHPPGFHPGLFSCAPSGSGGVWAGFGHVQGLKPWVIFGGLFGMTEGHALLQGPLVGDRAFPPQAQRARRRWGTHFRGWLTDTRLRRVGCFKKR